MQIQYFLHIKHEDTKKKLFLLLFKKNRSQWKYKKTE